MSLLLALIAATATPASSAATSSTTNDPMDKVKCVREAVIGSISKTRRVCHTLREWKSIRQNAEDEARRITQPGSPNPPPS